MDQPAQKSLVTVVAVVFAVFLLVTVIIFIKINFSNKSQPGPPQADQERAVEVGNPTFVATVTCTAEGSPVIEIFRKDGINVSGFVEVSRVETFSDATQVQIKPGEKSVVAPVEVGSESVQYFARMGYEVEGGYIWSEVQQIRVDGCTK